MAIILACFAISIAIATFIENDYGSETARALIYNAIWFEILLFTGIINLVGVLIIAKLYRLEKWPIFTFHVAFIIILLGAGITRFFGLEGTMHIREGDFSNRVISERNYLKAEIHYNKQKKYFEKAVYISSVGRNNITFKAEMPEKKIVLECLNIQHGVKEVAIPNNDGSSILEIVLAGKNGRQDILLKDKHSFDVDNYTISLNSPNQGEIKLAYNGDKLEIMANSRIISSDMSTANIDTLEANKTHEVYLLTIYKIDSLEFVIKNAYPRALTKIIPEEDPMNAQYGMEFKLSVGDSMKNRYYISSPENNPQYISLDNVTVSVSFGPKVFTVPFHLGLDKFIVEHYPGSKSPSWFESKIILVDSLNNVQRRERIFMNNVLQYEGYRFYQTSYDPDEKGTILSVNKDYWGTLVSYTGYFLLFAGMIFSLFLKNSRFRKLSESLNNAKLNKSAITIVLLVIVTNIYAETNGNPIINKEHASRFGQLLVQDHSGRIKPINTLSSEIIRKISRKQQIDGQTSDQIFLGMITHPEIWQKTPIIKVSHPQIRKLLNSAGPLIPFETFFKDTNDHYKYILEPYVDEAYRKKPAARSKFDNEILRTDERVNLCYLVFSGKLLKIFPSPQDSSDNWHTPLNAGAGLHSEDSMLFASVFPLYLQTLSKDTIGQELQNELLAAIADYQQKYGSHLIPSQSKINLEIFYNKLNIFDRIAPFYGLLGFVLLTLQFVSIFRPQSSFRVFQKILAALIGVCFFAHISGLAMRWFISGHAPWSNGYESLLYIAFATVLAGLLFSKKSVFTLAISSILAWLILHVAHLNWMDPEITPLVPVLKSYWLLIHVAIITASYGFMAIAALMAFLNLNLMAFQKESNFEKSKTVIIELTTIIEMAIIIGLYLLTIGTFLGGIWANESWGRYWAWDPKETWALVSILIYAFVVHVRLIPAFKSMYLFNLLALLAFSTILMTYFGVNYYLSGLHSYAKGDPVPVPSFVYYSLFVIIAVATTAWIKQRKTGLLRE